MTQAGECQCEGCKRARVEEDWATVGAKPYVFSTKGRPREPRHLSTDRLGVTPGEYFADFERFKPPPHIREAALAGARLLAALKKTPGPLYIHMGVEAWEAIKVCVAYRGVLSQVPPFNAYLVGDTEVIINPLLGGKWHTASHPACCWPRPCL